MKTTIGRIVHYKPNTQEKESLKFENAGVLNNTQDILPAIIVAVWSDTCVNLKVIVDGNTGFIWSTSRNQGDEEGQWNWPIIAPQVVPQNSGTSVG